ncbi:sensory neuron membrane protein 1-like [Culicoides brevitarsis]|uniref:sensory neuron membrane protein 1-like n=1 Tax=Culicoides brevitarsis TaxID=469753 RepID=UPI00307B2C2E
MEVLSKTKFNYKVLFIIFAVLFSVGVVFGFLGFPKLLEYVITKNMKLMPGNAIREMFLKVPFPLTFNVYLFNVTNPDEVQMGKTPVVHEVGPYVFEEWKDKYDVEDDEVHDKLSFNLRNTFIYRPDLTLPLTGAEIFTMPHLILMAGSIAAYKDRPEMMNLVVSGMDAIFDNPTTPFVTAKAYDLIFDGLLINCNKSDFGAKVICAVMRNEMMDQFEVIDESHLKLSLLKAQNHTDAGRYSVYRGRTNVKDVGKIIEYNNELELDTYENDTCNQFNGTDGLIFPPFLKETDEIWAFEHSLCRSFAVKFQSKSSFEDIQTSRFALEIPDVKNDPNLWCFCKNPPNDCPVKGTFDLSMCTSAPLVGSKPHFYDADPVLRCHVRGLNPQKELHESVVDFYMLTGTPLNGARRLQINLDMVPVPTYPILKDLPTALLPMIWLEEKITMNKTFVDDMKVIIFFQNLNNILRYVCILFGAIGGAVSAYYLINGPTKKLALEKRLSM